MLKAVAKILMKLKTTAVIEGLGEIKPIQEPKIELITPTEGQQFNEGEDVIFEYQITNPQGKEIKSVILTIFSPQTGIVFTNEYFPPLENPITVSDLPVGNFLTGIAFYFVGEIDPAAHTESSITINEVIAPLTLEITAPTNNQEFDEGTDVTVEFEFNREAPEVDKVELRIDGSVSQTRTTAPFDADFTVSNLSVDTHTIEVFAFEGAELLAADTVDVVVEAPAQELLLDIYPNTAGESWSLMQINSNYNGNILELRRDDNDTMLVQFDAGQLPQAAIAAWAGSGKAYVTKWNGQSGNGLFVQQVNAANQPWIYDNGFVLEGGLPTMIFAGNQYLDGGDILDPSLRPLYTFAIATVDEDDSTIYSKSQTGAPPIPGRWAIYHSLNALTLDVILETDEVLSIMGINPNITMNNRLLYSQESNNCHRAYINNLLEIEDLSDVSNVEESLFPFRIGSYSNPNPVRFLTGTIQAIHIYLNDVSAQRSAISTEIMNRYGIS